MQDKFSQVMKSTLPPKTLAQLMRELSLVRLEISRLPKNASALKVNQAISSVVASLEAEEQYKNVTTGSVVKDDDKMDESPIISELSSTKNGDKKGILPNSSTACTGGKTTPAAANKDTPRSCSSRSQSRSANDSSDGGRHCNGSRSYKRRSRSRSGSHSSSSSCVTCYFHRECSKVENSQEYLPPHRNSLIVLEGDTVASTSQRKESEWWKKDHQAFVETARTDDPAVIFLGDTIMKLASFRCANVWRELFESIGAKNFSCSGDRTQNTLWRIKHNTLPKNLKLLVLYLGSISLEHYEANIVHDAMQVVVHEIRRKRPEASIIVCGLVPKDLHFTDHKRRLLAFNNLLQKTFTDTMLNVFYLPPENIWSGPTGDLNVKYYMENFKTPNQLGYSKLLHHIFDKVQTVLRERESDESQNKMRKLVEYLTIKNKGRRPSSVPSTASSSSSRRDGRGGRSRSTSRSSPYSRSYRSSRRSRSWSSSGYSRSASSRSRSYSRGRSSRSSSHSSRASNVASSRGSRGSRRSYRSSSRSYYSRSRSRSPNRSLSPSYSRSSHSRSRSTSRSPRSRSQSSSSHSRGTGSWSRSPRKKNNNHRKEGIDSNCKQHPPRPHPSHPKKHRSHRRSLNPKSGSVSSCSSRSASSARSGDSLLCTCKHLVQVECYSSSCSESVTVEKPRHRRRNREPTHPKHSSSPAEQKEKYETIDAQRKAPTVSDPLDKGDSGKTLIPSSILSQRSPKRTVQTATESKLSDLAMTRAPSADPTQEVLSSVQLIPSPGRVIPSITMTLPRTHVLDVPNPLSEELLPMANKGGQQTPASSGQKSKISMRWSRRNARSSSQTQMGMLEGYYRDQDEAMSRCDTRDQPEGSEQEVVMFKKGRVPPLASSPRSPDTASEVHISGTGGFLQVIPTVEESTHVKRSSPVVSQLQQPVGLVESSGLSRAPVLVDSANEKGSRILRTAVASSDSLKDKLPEHACQLEQWEGPVKDQGGAASMDGTQNEESTQAETSAGVDNEMTSMAGQETTMDNGSMVEDGWDYAQQRKIKKATTSRIRKKRRPAMLTELLQDLERPQEDATGEQAVYRTGKNMCVNENDAHQSDVGAGKIAASRNLKVRKRKATMLNDPHCEVMTREEDVTAVLEDVPADEDPQQLPENSKRRKVTKSQKVKKCKAPTLNDPDCDMDGSSEVIPIDVTVVLEDVPADEDPQQLPENSKRQKVAKSQKWEKHKATALNGPDCELQGQRQVSTLGNITDLMEQSRSGSGEERESFPKPSNKKAVKGRKVIKQRAAMLNDLWNEPERSNSTAEPCSPVVAEQQSYVRSKIPKATKNRRAKKVGGVATLNDPDCDLDGFHEVTMREDVDTLDGSRLLYDKGKLLSMTPKLRKVGKGRKVQKQRAATLNDLDLDIQVRNEVTSIDEEPDMVEVFREGDEKGLRKNFLSKKKTSSKSLRVRKEVLTVNDGSHHSPIAPGTVFEPEESSGVEGPSKRRKMKTVRETDPVSSTEKQYLGEAKKCETSKYRAPGGFDTGNMAAQRRLSSSSCKKALPYFLLVLREMIENSSRHTSTSDEESKQTSQGVWNLAPDSVESAEAQLSYQANSVSEVTPKKVHRAVAVKQLMHEIRVLRKTALQLKRSGNYLAVERTLQAVSALRLSISAALSGAACGVEGTGCGPSETTHPSLVSKCKQDISGQQSSTQMSHGLVSCSGKGDSCSYPSELLSDIASTSLATSLSLRGAEGCHPQEAVQECGSADIKPARETIKEKAVRKSRNMRKVYHSSARYLRADGHRESLCDAREDWAPSRQYKFHKMTDRVEGSAYVTVGEGAFCSDHRQVGASDSHVVRSFHPSIPTPRSQAPPQLWAGDNNMDFNRDAINVGMEGARMRECYGNAVNIQGYPFTFRRMSTSELEETPSGVTLAHQGDGGVHVNASIQSSRATPESRFHHSSTEVLERHCYNAKSTEGHLPERNRTYQSNDRAISFNRQHEECRLPVSGGMYRDTHPWDSLCYGENSHEFAEMELAVGDSINSTQYVYQRRSSESAADIPRQNPPPCKPVVETSSVGVPAMTRSHNNSCEDPSVRIGDNPRPCFPRHTEEDYTSPADQTRKGVGMAQRLHIQHALGRGTVIEQSAAETPPHLHDPNLSSAHFISNRCRPDDPRNLSGATGGTFPSDCFQLRRSAAQNETAASYLDTGLAAPSSILGRTTPTLASFNRNAARPTPTEGVAPVSVHGNWAHTNTIVAASHRRLNETAGQQDSSIENHTEVSQPPDSNYLKASRLSTGHRSLETGDLSEARSRDKAACKINKIDDHGKDTINVAVESTPALSDPDRRVERMPGNNAGVCFRTVGSTEPEMLPTARRRY